MNDFLIELNSASKALVSVSSSDCDIAFNIPIDYITARDDELRIIGNDDSFFCIKQLSNFSIMEMDDEYLLHNGATSILFTTAA